MRHGIGYGHIGFGLLALAAALASFAPANAEEPKHGGILKIYHR